MNTTDIGNIQEQQQQQCIDSEESKTRCLTFGSFQLLLDQKCTEQQCQHDTNIPLPHNNKRPQKLPTERTTAHSVNVSPLLRSLQSIRNIRLWDRYHDHRDNTVDENSLDNYDNEKENGSHTMSHKNGNNNNCIVSSSDHAFHRSLNKHKAIGHLPLSLTTALSNEEILSELRHRKEVLPQTTEEWIFPGRPCWIAFRFSNHTPTDTSPKVSSTKETITHLGSSTFKNDSSNQYRNATESDINKNGNSHGLFFLKKESTPTTKESTPTTKESTPTAKESTPTTKESTPTVLKSQNCKDNHTSHHSKSKVFKSISSFSTPQRIPSSKSMDQVDHEHTEARRCNKVFGRANLRPSSTFNVSAHNISTNDANCKLNSNFYVSSTYFRSNLKSCSLHLANLHNDEKDSKTAMNRICNNKSEFLSDFELTKTKDCANNNRLLSSCAGTKHHSTPQNSSDTFENNKLNQGNSNNHHLSQPIRPLTFDDVPSPDPLLASHLNLKRPFESDVDQKWSHQRFNNYVHSHTKKHLLHHTSFLPPIFRHRSSLISKTPEPDTELNPQWYSAVKQAEQLKVYKTSRVTSAGARHWDNWGSCWIARRYSLSLHAAIGTFLMNRCNNTMKTFPHIGQKFNPNNSPETPHALAMEDIISVERLTHIEKYKHDPNVKGGLDSIALALEFASDLAGRRRNKSIPSKKYKMLLCVPLKPKTIRVQKKRKQKGTDNEDEQQKDIFSTQELNSRNANSSLGSESSPSELPSKEFPSSRTAIIKSKSINSFLILVFDNTTDCNEFVNLASVLIDFWGKGAHKNK